MATITSVSVATRHQPHSGSNRSSLTLPRCISLPENPERHHISLTHHCSHSNLPSLFSSSPQSTNYFHGGGGDFGGGSDGGGNFGGSNSGDGSEVDKGDMIVFCRDDLDRFVADLSKTADEVERRSLPYSDSSFYSLLVSHTSKVAAISVLLRGIELKTGFFSGFFHDKNDKITPASTEKES